jgi:hypothetical protein
MVVESYLATGSQRMKRIIACLIAAIACGVSAQTAPDPSGAAPKSEILRKQTCSGCGEVRTVRRIERQPRASTPMSEMKEPSGLVATIPLGGGGKPTLGSSTREEKRRDPPLVTYEIVVLLDDGGIRVVMQDESDELRPGDKVRIEDNKVMLR